MAESSDLIRAVAELAKALQWPLVALIISLFFRGDIRKLLGRVRRGKMLGAEVELGDALDKLEAGTAKDAPQVPPAIPEHRIPEEADLDRAEPEDAEQFVLRQAAISPRAALMLLSADIERELRELLTSRGQMPGYSYTSPREAIAVLFELGEVSPDTVANVSQFWKVRNLIIHGREGEEGDILRAIDSGLVILRTLKALPRRVVKVIHPDLTVYSDSDGKQPTDGTWGVMVETTNPLSPDRKPVRSVLPSFHPYLRPGGQVYVVRLVGQRLPAAWFRHPETGNMEKAWDEGIERRSIRHAEGFWHEGRWYPLPPDMMAKMQGAQNWEPPVSPDGTT